LGIEIYQQIDKKEVSINALLKEKCNPSGYFSLIVVLIASGA